MEFKKVYYKVICLCFSSKFPRELLQPVIGKQVNADWWSRNLQRLKAEGRVHDQAVLLWHV